MAIRLFRPGDERALYEVCLRTGADGEDASALHEDPLQLGEVFVGPYLALQPSLAFVLDPTALDPTALDPTALDPTVLHPTVLHPTVLHPTVLDPAALDPAALDPAALAPGTLSPGGLNPGTLNPSVPNPGVTDPGGLDPGGLEPGDPDPRDPDPRDPDPRGLDPGDPGGLGGGPFGYALGVLSTRAFEAACERHWWPPLRRRYPPDPGSWLTELIHHPIPAPADVVAAYPSHLHIDLLPAYQGAGWGRRMLTRLFAELTARGSTGVHLGVSPTNLRAIAFYRKLGFTDLAHTDDTLTMGLKL